MRKDRRIQHAVEEADSEGTWAISYGDMITLLLTFFILFYSVNPSRDQEQTLQTAMIQSLSAHPPTGERASFESEKISEGKVAKASGIEERVVNDWGGEVEKSGARVLVRFPQISFFNSAKTEILPSGEAALKKFVERFLPYAAHHQVVIRAFADQRAVRAEGRAFKDNLELSALRSVSAMRSLQKLGLPLSQMRVGGYGEVRSLAKEAPKAADLAAARKIVLVIEPVLKESL